MKRGFLEELGLEKDVIDKVMEEYGRDVEKYKADIAVLENEKTALTSNIAERDEQLTALKESAGASENLKAQIEELQATNKADVERLTAENKAIRINAAVEQALLLAKAKNITATKSLLNLTDAELTEDGTVKGLTDQIDKLKAAEDSSFMFEPDSAPQIKGVTPKDGKDEPQSYDYQTLYNKAKAEGNQAEAVRLKTEAFAKAGEVLV